MLIINFEGREAKGLSKGRYDETFAGEDDDLVALIEFKNFSFQNYHDYVTFQSKQKDRYYFSVAFPMRKTLLT